MLFKLNWVSFALYATNYSFTLYNIKISFNWYFELLCSWIADLSAGFGSKFYQQDWGSKFCLLVEIKL